VIDKDKAKLKLLITANDGGHAQAQAADISRALKADKFYLGYELCPPTYLSELFRRLAYNDFSHKQCDLWYVRRHIYRNCLEDWHIMTFLINNVICGLGLSVTKIL
jgi:hypothetical protein